jgi:hypothetical protein
MIHRLVAQPVLVMRVFTIIKYVFTALGLCMLVGAFFIYRSTSGFLASAQTAEGTVIDLVASRSSDSTTYRPVVRFVTDDGRTIEFTSSAGSNPPSYSRGETVPVLYTPKTPEDAKINGFFALWGGVTILGGLGAVFFVIGAAFFLVVGQTRRKNEYLRSQGQPIETQLQGVERNTSIRANGTHPYRVVTQWQNPATGAVHVFKSENLWYDPTQFLQRDRITVLIERDNPRRYLVDLSFLPQRAD